MARNKGPHPSVLRGGPAHGSDFEEQLPLDATNEEVEGDEEEDLEEEHTEDESDPIVQMRRELDMVKDQNRMLQRMIPPPTPVQISDSEADDDDTDWDNLIFSDPKGAVKKIKEQAVAEAKRDLRKEYSTDQQTNKFWSDFYGAHQDLKDDHDLVEVMLEKHMSEIGDLPVAKAMEKLADLTRKRIMRYSGNKGQPRSRAVAEGASPPTAKKPKVEQPKATTLSDIIRNRREGRRKAASAA